MQENRKEINKKKKKKERKPHKFYHNIGTKKKINLKKKISLCIILSVFVKAF